MDMEKNKRSREFGMAAGGLIRSGSLPRFGEHAFIHGTEESDGQVVDTNFGNLVR